MYVSSFFYFSVTEPFFFLCCRELHHYLSFAFFCRFLVFSFFDQFVWSFVIYLSDLSSFFCPVVVFFLTAYSLFSFFFF